MYCVGILSIVLTLINVVKLNPVVNVPAASSFQDSNIEPLPHVGKPIELKPQSWDSYTPEVVGADTMTVVSARPTTPEVTRVKIYSPVELQPSSHDLGVETTTQPPTPIPTPTPTPASVPYTKAPEIDSVFNIRLRPRSDHQIGPPNSTVFVFGDGFMRPLNKRDFTVPRFNPFYFLRSALKQSPRPLKLPVVKELPYFKFFAPGMEQLLATMKTEHLRVKRSPLHRVKRHHTAVLQNVLGQLQNFALVPIRSNSGRTNYILLKNPKFVIGGNVLSPTPPPAAAVPTIIQIGQQPTTKPVQNVVFRPSVVIPAVDPTRQTSARHLGRNAPPQSAQHIATASSVDYHHAHHVPIHTKTRQQPVAILGGRDTPDYISPAHVAPLRTVQPSAVPEIARGVPNLSPFTSKHSVGGGEHVGQLRGNGGTVVGGGSVGATATATGGGLGGGAVEKTEVVETVVETQQHEQAAAAGSQAASAMTAGTSNTAVKGAAGAGSAGAITDTAQTSQTAAAGSVSAVKQGKKVVTKKTTTTKLKGDGAGGAVKEVSQVVEQSVHNDAAVATADTAATSVGVSSGSSVVANGAAPSDSGTAVATGAASAVVNSANTASASNTSVKSVKTIKKTTVTKTKVAQPSAPINMPKTVPSAMSILAETTGGNQLAPRPKAKTAILSDNNDRIAINKQPALIATQAPKKAARIVKQQRRRPKKKRKTTKRTPTTAEMELEAEEFTTTLAYGDPARTAPAEKRAELRKLARERARAAANVKKQLARKPARRGRPRPQQNQPEQQQTFRGERPVPWHRPNMGRNKIWRNVITRDKSPSRSIPRSRSRPYDSANRYQDQWTGPTTVYPPNESLANDVGPQRQAPPNGRRRGRNRGRNRNRGSNWGTNNRRRSNRRLRDREEQPPFRDPFARWLYNNLETEMMERILPLWFLG